jgi:uncharacterized protein (TIGR02646 family)
MPEKRVAVMIPVALQPEPGDFNEKVRQPGRRWLTANGIDPDSPPPKATALPNYWTRSNKQLWEAYSGVCAYLAIFFEWVTGASSTDHFIAKSKHAGNAYEWDNFRLSCLGPNRTKHHFDDLLDPIGLAPDTFFLNLADGKIRPNPSLSPDQKKAALKTIRRLRLNSPDHQDMRARHFSHYLEGKDEKILRQLSPFVWYEAKRQELL